jgi:hypothetical protein
MELNQPTAPGATTAFFNRIGGNRTSVVVSAAIVGAAGNSQESLHFAPPIGR